jgi:hypothetical protein
MSEPIEEAFIVTTEGGLVLVDGEGAALSMTVEAAQQLADQLSAAVIVALGQRAVG